MHNKVVERIGGGDTCTEFDEQKRFHTINCNQAMRKQGHIVGATYKLEICNRYHWFYEQIVECKEGGKNVFSKICSIWCTQILI